MYSQEDLLKAVGYVQEPLPKADVRVPSDVTNSPNNIYISHLMSQQPSEIEIMTLLSEPDNLTTRLNEAFPKKPDRSDMPTLGGMGITWDRSVGFLTHALHEVTGKFTVGYGKNRLIIADTEQKTFTFPSGLKTTYYELTNEVSANANIFDMGFGIAHESKGRQQFTIYVRKTSKDFMSALAKHQSPRRSDMPYAPNLGANIPALVIAHEITELAIRSEEDIDDYLTGSEIEQMTEREMPRFLIQHGVAPLYQRAFHHLRANTNGEKNESRKWLDSY